MNRAEFEAHLVDKAWRDEVFREELLRDPKAVVARELAQLREGDVLFPEHLKISVMQESEDQLYLVIPPLPKREPEMGEGERPSSGGGYYVSLFMPGAQLKFKARDL